MSTLSLEASKKILLDEKNKYLLENYSFCINRDGYLHARSEGKVKTLHYFFLKKKDGFVVDHINGNKLDNRISNLRYVTHAQNVMNQAKRITNSSGYKGVTWNKEAKKWKVQLGLNGKRHFGGYFDDLEEAAKAYNKHAKRLFGKYCRLNVI